MENLKFTELLQLNKDLAARMEGKPLSIGILSNVTVNSFKEVLEYGCRINNIVPEVEIGNFDNIVQDSATFSNKNSVIIFYDTLNIIDNVSGFFDAISDELFITLKQKLFSEFDIIFNNLKNVPSVVFNTFSSAYYPNNSLNPSKADELVQELNTYINSQKPQNVTIINIDKIYIQLGINEAIDFRFYLSSKAPYKFSFFKKYTEAIIPVLLKSNGKLKKAIIFDCDNTLWKGIIGEDGLEGIDISPSSPNGKHFHTIQQIAVFLSKRGIIVGICSKNNEQDVTEVFKNHHDMVLKEEHIVAKKINWNNKASNLKEMAADLNIGTDSFVFVDDSSFEINLIKEQLPEVLTVQVPVKTSEYVNILLKIIYANFNLIPTSDDLKKTEMYKQQFERENSKSSFASIDDYLSSLQIELKILKNDPAYIPRLSQLTQKTNQFNLTTYRYTESEMERFIYDPKINVYAMFVKDKFGDSGLTGVCIIKQDEKNHKHAIIDSLLMSCRILGRNIEYVYVETIISDLSDLGFETVGARFIPTKKNAQVESFYDQLGLKYTGTDNNIKNYFLDIKNLNARKINYIKVISNIKENAN